MEISNGVCPELKGQGLAGIRTLTYLAQDNYKMPGPLDSGGQEGLSRALWTGFNGGGTAPRGCQRSRKGRTRALKPREGPAVQPPTCTTNLQA